MIAEKQLMMEAAVLYYEKKHTQQDIARILKLSRQTVSKLLNDALDEHIVEFKIHNPEQDCADLEQKLCEHFGIQRAVVCSVSGKDDRLCQLMTVKKAADYLQPILRRGNQQIAISWGRTLQALIAELPDVHASGNVVFPLFGATDIEKPCFLSNELARNFADRIGAEVKYAWFPYRPDQAEDCALLKKTSYYKKMSAHWDEIDLAIVGIGNTTMVQLFEDVFGYHEKSDCAVGDIATHLFTADGTLIAPYDHALCASAENLKTARETVAIACSSVENDKCTAIAGALRTGLINTLITDDRSARTILNAVTTG
ncbi:MAG: hypothetical protein LKJ86_09580 [Oscillibacter sp.]|jgi:deoxyribonucleoside regulator|nr:hypothetical protein [Oscillibacter sp.]